MDNNEDSKLVEHARNELNIMGLLNESSDYNGMLGRAALDLIKLFASQSHSGSSADLTITLFTQLAKWELLSEPTDAKEEWEDRTEQSGYPLWQNRRGPAYFSEDGGKHWYHVNSDKKGTSKPVGNSDNIIGYDPGSPNGDYQTTVYGRKNEDGTFDVKRIETTDAS